MSMINSHTVAAGAAICWLISIGPGTTCSPATHLSPDPTARLPPTGTRKIHSDCW